MAMKKIIHLSDLHIGADDCGIKFRTIVENITLLKQPSENYIIVITGDIVDNATHSEQVDEAVEAIGQLEKEGYQVLVVPGNHDYGTGAWGHVKYVKTFKERFYKTAKISYPKVDLIDELAFIGLDSTAEELHWYDSLLSEGEIGKGQLARLKKILKDPEVVSRTRILYLHHHPFDFKFGMQLKDRDELKKVVKNQVHAILFGHFHAFSGSAGKIFHGMWDIPRCYNAGSSTHKNGDCGFHRVINMSEADPRVDYDGNFL
jgi:3',5'-cyclic AMP phosphodiesterase CpdA